MTTKQELEEQLKQVTAERDVLLEATQDMRMYDGKPDELEADALGSRAQSLSNQMSAIDSRMSTVGGLPLSEGEKAVLKRYHTDSREKLTAEYDNILMKLNGGK